MNRVLSLSICLLLSLTSLCQLPNTDLWLFRIETDKKLNQTILKEAQNITNREGYDNQPSFSADGKKIYYVSIRDDKQADIYYYDIGHKLNVPLTKSKVSEYSPTPAEEGRSLASVVVEADSAQRIHFMNAVSGSDEKKLEMDSVGYFTFVNADTLVYYKLTQPHSLRYYAKSSGEDKWLANSPIRTFRTINRHSFVFGIKDSAQVIFYIYDFLLQKAQRYTSYPSTNEDIFWHPTLGLLKSEGTQLLRFDEAGQSWVLLFELSSFGIKKITRFAFDAQNKYLVVVNNL